MAWFVAIEQIILPGRNPFTLQDQRMSHPDEPELNAEELRQKIKLETGQLSWQELQRHFAHGVVVVVSQELDLIEVAAAFAEDDKARFEAWIEANKVWRAKDDDAIQWHASNAEFWSAVVAPWVLVQLKDTKN